MDAAVFEGGRLGLGVVVRDHIEDVLAASYLRIRGEENAKIAEAMAAQHGLKVTIEAGLTSLVSETDCIKLYQHRKAKRQEANYFGKLACQEK
ncbi:Tryptophan synthase beta chain [Bienertia sinuspersici]